MSVPKCTHEDTSVVSDCLAPETFLHERIN